MRVSSADRPISSLAVRDPQRIADDMIGIARQVRHAQHAAEPPELPVIADGDDDVPVRDRKHLVGHDVGMGVAHAASAILPETR